MPLRKKNLKKQCDLALRTAAVLSEVNMSNNAWEGVNRLVAAFTGVYISATRKLLNLFTTRVPNAVISHFDYEYDESKDPERINYFAIEIPELTTMLIERELAVRVRQEKPDMFWSQGNSGIFFQTVEDRERCQSSELPKYGYETCDFKDPHSDGIYALLTSDHGKGASLGVLRFLLQSSNDRRLRNSPDYGTISFPFYRMVCKKDPSEVVQYLAPYVNRGIDVLSKSRLIAARNEKNSFDAFLSQKSQQLFQCYYLIASCAAFILTKREKAAAMKPMLPISTTAILTIGRQYRILIFVALPIYFSFSWPKGEREWHPIDACIVIFQ